MKLLTNSLRLVLASVAFLTTVFVAHSQTYNNPGGTINTCSGTFYDTGGSGGNYGNNQSITTTICSNAGNCVQLAFTSFTLESSYDYMYIYDGPSTGSTLIGTYTGSSSPGTVVSSTGCLTIRFTSDGSVTYGGWAATISCVSCSAPPSNCSGTFYDSGGAGGNYSNSESTTNTFCSGSSDCVQLSFSSFSTESGYDVLYIYDGPNASSPLLGQYTGTASPGVITSSGGCLTVVFTSDGSVTSGGWAASISCVTSCSAGPPPAPTNVNCNVPDPICSGSPIVFTAQANGTEASTVNPGNDYDCLYTSPNPSWYYLEISTGGNLVIDITAGSDVDFEIWGPFPNISNAISNCNSYGVPEDCSYSTSAIEQANVSGVVAGEVYVLLVTNYANTVQTITVSDAATNTATTNCAIVPLAVELMEFDGVSTREGVILTWATAFEKNNSHFVVERSEDALVWSTVDVVLGGGTTTNEQHYQITDTHAARGQNYYRLKQVDFDGSITISDIISVSASDMSEIMVYPNPAHDKFTVLSGQDILSITVLDIRGSEVYTRNTDHVNGTYIDVEQFRAGIYFLQVELASGVVTERITIEH